MAVESGTYISDLNAANPALDTDVAEGDDHIRLLKSTIKATFPNVTGAATATHTELNLIDGSSAGTIVNSKAVIYGASGEVNATTLQIGGTSITSSAAELNILDGVTASAAELNLVDTAVAGTIVNSKAVIYGSSGEVNATTLQIGGDAITSSASELNMLDGVVGKLVSLPTTWTAMTGTTAASAGNGYYHATNSNYTLTLPSSPAAGDTIFIALGGSGEITCARNGSNINAKAGDVVLATNPSAGMLVYSGDSTVGWVAVLGG